MTIRLRRNTRQYFNDVALKGGFLEGEPLFITDEAKTAIATSINSFSPNAMLSDLFGFRNKAHNGKFEIGQRGVAFTSPASGTYIFDRWVAINTTSALYNTSQSTSVPSNEFQYSLALTVTTADTSIAAGDVARILQRFEGFNVRDLLETTFVVSFWVRSAKTGVHCVALRNGGSDRSYVHEYTINSANTWEKKFLKVIGGIPNSGTNIWNNGLGLQLSFDLVSGTTTQTSTAGSWVTGNFTSTPNQVNVLDTIGNVFGITGVQLEVGTEPTRFEHRPYGVEDFICKRYFERQTTSPVATSPFSSFACLCISTTQAYVTLSPKVPKRAAVSSATSAATTFALIYGTGTVGVGTAISVVNTSPESILLQLTIASGLTAGQSAILYGVGGTTPFVDFNSDL